MNRENRTVKKIQYFLLMDILSGRKQVLSSTFLTFSAWCLLHRKTARFNSNSRNGRTVFFCVAFRGDFQGKYSRRAAPKSPLVLRTGQTMPREIVVFRYRFGVHFAGSLCCRSCPRLWRRFALLGTLVPVRVPPFPCRKSLRYIAGEHIPYRPVIRLE